MRKVQQTIQFAACYAAYKQKKLSILNYQYQKACNMKEQGNKVYMGSHLFTSGGNLAERALWAAAAMASPYF